MGNRKLPFGYQMELGEVVIRPREAEIVQYIYKQYLAGASFGTLVDKLREQPVLYDAPRRWNKNMVARILEDRRYTGEKEYPVIIRQSDFEAAAQRRAKRQCPYRQTEAQKALRQLCGHRVTQRQEQQVLTLLNSLAGKPERITVQASDRAAYTALRRELDQMLAKIPVDEDRAKALAFQTAAAQYQSIGPYEYESQRLHRIFAEHTPTEELNAELLHATVSAVMIDSGGNVSLRLKNQQIIKKRRENT